MRIPEVVPDATLLARKLHEQCAAKNEQDVRTSNGSAASDATVTGSYQLHEVDDVRTTTVMVTARYYLVKTTSRSRRTSPHTPLQAVLS